jgi:hypothetical protein
LKMPTKESVRSMRRIEIDDRVMSGDDRKARAERLWMTPDMTTLEGKQKLTIWCGGPKLTSVQAMRLDSLNSFRWRWVSVTNQIFLWYPVPFVFISIYLTVHPRSQDLSGGDSSVKLTPQFCGRSGIDLW